MKFRISIFSVLLGLFLATTCPIFAGGQLVHLEADSYGSINSDGTYGRIMRVVNEAFPCEGTSVTFKFTDPKDGDYIKTSSGNETFVFTKDRPSYYKNGENVCGTTAKMGSKVKGERFVTVVVKNGDSIWGEGNAPVIKVDFDGQYHADNSYNDHHYSSSQDDPYYRLNHPEPFSTPTPYPHPKGELKVWVLNQERVAPYGREVTLKWSALDGPNIFYGIYGRGSAETSWIRLLLDEGGPSATVNIRADQDYFVKVSGCIRKVGNCVDSNELLLPKMQQQDGRLLTPQPPQATIYPTPTEDSSRVDDLNKKVENLQNQLNQSQKKQQETESRLNWLINWIRSIFPFFSR